MQCSTVVVVVVLTVMEIQPIWFVKKTFVALSAENVDSLSGLSPSLSSSFDKKRSKRLPGPK